MAKAKRDYWYNYVDIHNLLTSKSQGGLLYYVADSASQNSEQAVQRVNEAFEILERNRELEAAVIPINLGNVRQGVYEGSHWVGLVIRRYPPGSNNLAAFYNDSLGTPMDESLPDLRQILRNNDIPYRRIIDFQMPQQNNGYDCGAWTVLNLDSLARTGSLPEATERDIIVQRIREFGYVRVVAPASFMGSSSSSSSSSMEPNKKPRVSLVALVRQQQLAAQAGIGAVEYEIPLDMIAIPLHEFDTTKSIREQQKIIRQNIIQELQAIENAQPQAERRQRRGYRFYNYDIGGLVSLAEQRGQPDLPLAIKEQFVSGHAGANKKVLIGEDGIVYYSPFLSLTGSLPDFVNTSFAPHGDLNIRHDVFHRSPVLGAFNVPTNAVGRPNLAGTNPDQDLPQKEQEFLFDTSADTTLSQFIVGNEYRNPFQGRVKVDFVKLLASRGLMSDKKLSYKVEEYNKKDAGFQKDTVLRYDDNYNYRKHLREGERLQKEILKHPRIFATHSRDASLESAPPVPGKSFLSTSSRASRRGVAPEGPRTSFVEPSEYKQQAAPRSIMGPPPAHFMRPSSSSSSSSMGPPRPPRSVRQSSSSSPSMAPPPTRPMGPPHAADNSSFGGSNRGLRRNISPPQSSSSASSSSISSLEPPAFAASSASGASNRGSKRDSAPESSRPSFVEHPEYGYQDVLYPMRQSSSSSPSVRPSSPIPSSVQQEAQGVGDNMRRDQQSRTPRSKSRPPNNRTPKNGPPTLKRGASL